MEVHRQLMQARRQDEDAMLRQAQDQARVPEPEGTVAPGSNESYEWYLFDIFIYNISNFVSVMIDNWKRKKKALQLLIDSISVSWEKVMILQQ